MQGISEFEKLSTAHKTRLFRCGQHSLDLFLQRYALANQRADSSLTYVVHRDFEVVGYYTLSFGSVSLDSAPEAIRTELPVHYSVPVMLFARFAVASSLQGQGLGRALLKDAFLRTVSAAEIGGLAAIVVDAIDAKMVAFYQRWGFQLCPGYERKLMLSIRDVRAHLAGRQGSA